MTGPGRSRVAAPRSTRRRRSGRPRAGRSRCASSFPVPEARAANLITRPRVRLGSVDSSITEVRYGGVVVGRSPQVRDRSDTGAFVVFSEPMPVGTTIALKIDDKEQFARVTEVVESADAAAAGMRVRFVSAAERNAPAPAARVPRAPRPAP